MRGKVLKNKCNRFLAFILCVTMLCGLTACGKSEGDTDNKADKSNESTQKEYVYVPEYFAMNTEDGWFNNMTLVGDMLYYSQYQYDEETETGSETIREYSLTDGSVKDLPVQMEAERNANGFCVDASENIYILYTDYSAGRENADGYSEPDMYVTKYDAQGSKVFDKDITEIVNRESTEPYTRGILVDEQGHIYVCMESAVIMLDENGEEHGTAGISSWINTYGIGKDGKAYITYYDQNSADGGTVLSVLDYENKKIGDTYQNFPGSDGQYLNAGAEKDFLVYNGSKLYEYDIATQSYEELLSWLDCDINGSYVEMVGAVGDGKLVAIISDWETDKTELVKLTKTSASEVAQKEEIIIGTLYESQELQASAVAFNKANDTYRVTIRNYIDTNNWTENSYQDAITKLNNDITSASNCPDILDLSDLDIKQLAAKGVIEDLNPYLEKSTVFSREDFLDNILEGFTYDGVLTTIPTCFYVNTVAAKASEVGAEMGWSLEEMLAFAKAHPDAALFDGVQQETILHYCMMFNQDIFVDWSTGECHFDDDSFKTVLEFVSMFPKEIDWENYDGGIKVEEHQKGKILLENVYLSDFQEIQIYPEVYGEPVTYIGFPTADGSVGCALTVSNQYGITSQSEHKEGAWAFLESYLDNAFDSRFSWGFPVFKDDLQTLIDEITKVEYLLDENGEMILDENGEPITTGGGSSIGWEDWEYTYHTSTQEEIEQVKELISVAKPVNISINDEIMKIITEEAAAYFSGQKSLDEVADIIQSRAQIYVSENS